MSISRISPLAGTVGSPGATGPTGPTGNPSLYLQVASTSYTTTAAATADTALAQTVTGSKFVFEYSYNANATAAVANTMGVQWSTGTPLSAVGKVKYAGAATTYYEQDNTHANSGSMPTFSAGPSTYTITPSNATVLGYNVTFVIFLTFSSSLTVTLSPCSANTTSQVIYGRYMAIQVLT